jgi:hypothetical protein
MGLSRASSGDVGRRRDGRESGTGRTTGGRSRQGTEGFLQVYSRKTRSRTRSRPQVPDREPAIRPAAPTVRRRPDGRSRARRRFAGRTPRRRPVARSDESELERPFAELITSVAPATAGERDRVCSTDVGSIRSVRQPYDVFGDVAAAASRRTESPYRFVFVPGSETAAELFPPRRKSGRAATFHRVLKPDTVEDPGIITSAFVVKRIVRTNVRLFVPRDSERRPDKLRHCGDAERRLR